MKRQENIPYYMHRHSCFLLRYHLILTTRRRQPVLVGAIQDRLYELTKETFSKWDMSILEMNNADDYVHILFEANPNMNLGEFITAYKTRTSRLIQKEYGDILLNTNSNDSSFWSLSYCVATDSTDSHTAIAQYLKNCNC